jgi:hypothetical protein
MELIKGDISKMLDNKKELQDEEERLEDIVIYRYKFTQEFMDELYKFSKIHQYDERKDFKEAWKTWLEDNEELVNTESRRVYNLGYDGDVLDKMFKSARYYFRKKTDEKKEPKERRKYITIGHELLDAMDKYILSNISNQPKNGFILFCRENEDLLKSSINVMLEKGVNDSDVIQDKIKKTYKHRYFILTKKK